ncbi:hypothetical protein C900_00909 [Fulvivirga imtechensis AK7]|uniref:LTD domain-containing protein n=1 Tax=Fulvivirga imtechensis AK7 TaxID=1237149 RepID=L8JXP1_9BACT|nr:lamin tail domain-containing protein [Fulvivirga imtechensis]ELR72948.1 hypothetical protein C900_00909 [Fulvivirga imtechensis AK7]
MLTLFRISFLPFTLISFCSFGQISDNFSDGEFTSNPAWSSSNNSGNGSDFLVTAGELQSNGPSANSTIWLSTAGIPDLSAGVVVWEFKARYGSAPSSTNNIEIFLASDQSDLGNNPAGYFVRLGKSGSEDGIDLFKTSSSTAIIADPNASVASGIDVNIRITRDAFGFWTLEADASGGTTFTLIGSAIDTEFVTGPHFGFKVKHTSTRNTSFFFDDVLVSVTDVSPPAITQVDVISETELAVTFSEALSQSTAEDITNYLVDHEIGQPTEAELDDMSNTVHLTFSNSFINAKLHELRIEHVSDLNGNAITTSTIEFLYFREEEAEKKDIIINEIFADPNPPNDLPEVEYIEIMNNSEKIFDLSGWTFADQASATTLEKLFLLPGELLILCPQANSRDFEPFGEVMGLSPWPSLNNAGDYLYVKDNHGRTIDSVNYTTTWYRDTGKSNGGWSLEVINPGNTCHVSSNWIASESVSGGTPGQQNSVFDPAIDQEAPRLKSAWVVNETTLSLTFDEPLDPLSIKVPDFHINGSISVVSITQEERLEQLSCELSAAIPYNTVFNITADNVSDCSGNIISSGNAAEFILVAEVPVSEKDVIINEIYPNPSEEADLPNAEYVELYNNSDKILNLEGWTFSDVSTIGKLKGVILFPGDHIILCPQANSRYFESFGEVMDLSPWPSLNNAGDYLYLKDNHGRTIDSVNYTTTWYRDTGKSNGGWSLEVINPGNTCHVSSNWIASESVSGGTPGQQNSVFDPAIDQEAPRLKSAWVVNETTLSLTFDEPLDPLSIKVPDFHINGSISVVSVTQEERLEQLSCELSAAIPYNTVFNITADNVSDCSGNIISSGNAAEFILVAEVPVSEKDVIINEIYPNPSEEADLPNAEYVELYNNSDKILNLEGWTFSDVSTSSEITGLVLFPGDYAILCNEKDRELFDKFDNTAALNPWPALNNTSDDLLLKNNYGYRVDSVTYNSSWYKSSSKSAGGWALELIDPANLCGDSRNWAASESDAGGTPGLVNSVLSDKPDLSGPEMTEALGITPDTLLIRFNESLDPGSIIGATYTITGGINIKGVIPAAGWQEVGLVLSDPLVRGIPYTVAVDDLTDCNGNAIGKLNSKEFKLIEPADHSDIIINEILFNPRKGGIDFVELYNRSDKHINLKNWILANGKMDGESISPNQIKTITSDDYIIEPTEYVVLTTDEILLKEEYPFGKEDRFLKCSSMPAFPDDKGIVIIMRADSLWLDSLIYSADWHFDLLADDEGVSLERVSADVPANRADNWKSAASTVGFATPGYMNSQSRPEITNRKGVIIIEPKVIVPDGKGLNDFATINYSFEKPGYVANVRILDLQGRTIRILSENDYLAAEGFFTWDATDENGGKARLGYYIVYFEVFDLDGRTHQYKEKVVVGTRF